MSEQTIGPPEESKATFSWNVEADMGKKNHLRLPEKTYQGTELEHVATEYDYPVEVDGKTMNVNIQGSGDTFIVLLAGRGVTAPSSDMAPLIDHLKDDQTVMTIDLFGSGLSDMTDTPRTSEQIASEVHEALSKLGVSEYSLVAHSISGMYGLQYANMFPDEVTGFVGIDTAVPNMDKLLREHNPELLDEAPHNEKEKSVSELVREDIADVVGHIYTEREIAIMEALKARNMGNDDVFEAMKQASKEGEKPYDDRQFPDHIPVAFYLSSESSGMASWYTREHERQLTSASAGKGGVTILEGSHFLHHNQAGAIAAGIKRLSI